MQNRKPIIIAGFGRSGTTWLSDIISKSLGGIILFEPFHPCVFDAARHHTYAVDTDHQALIAQWQMSLQKIRHRWLLRNHLRVPIEQIPLSYIDEIWKHCDIIGFKTIRLNHQLDQLTEDLNAQTIYILRHPLAVISSIQGRHRFWEEFGWNWHWETFTSRALDFFTDKQICAALLQQQKALKTDHEKVAFMWTISVIISLTKLQNTAALIVRYEDLYDQPYLTTKSLLNQLGEDKPIHPAYIFEPSMTTLRTFHNSEANTSTPYKAPDVFWKDRISPGEAKSLIEVVQAVLRISGFKHDVINPYLD